MSAQLQRGISAGAGLVCGAALTLAAAASAPEQAPIPVDAPVIVRTLPAACPDRQAALRARIATLERDAAQIALQRRMIEARRIQREGAEQPWPNDVDPLLVPETLVAHVREAVRVFPEGWVAAEDCDEFPCVIAVATGAPEDNPRGTSGRTFQPFFDALNDRGYTDHEAMNLIQFTAEGTDVLVFAIGPETGADADKTRTGFRVGDTYERLALGGLGEPDP